MSFILTPTATVGNGGATISSISSNLVLTATSNKVQVVTATTTSLSVILPTAITASLGFGLYVIKNAGTNTFAIRDNGGNFIISLTAGQECVMSLTSQADANGTWIVGNLSIYSFLSSANVGAVNTLFSGTNDNAQTQLTSGTTNTYLIVSNNSGVVTARILSQTGSTISVSSASTLFASGGGSPKVSAFSATKAILVIGSNCYVVTISGTTVTIGGAYNYYTGSAGSYQVQAVSSTGAVIGFTGATNYRRWIGVKWDGSTSFTSTSIGVETGYDFSYFQNIGYGKPGLAVTTLQLGRSGSWYGTYAGSLSFDEVGMTIGFTLGYVLTNESTQFGGITTGINYTSDGVGTIAYVSRAGSLYFGGYTISGTTVNGSGTSLASTGSNGELQVQTLVSGTSWIVSNSNGSGVLSSYYIKYSSVTTQYTLGTTVTDNSVTSSQNLLGGPINSAAVFLDYYNSTTGNVQSQVIEISTQTG
jgi:hypothetical protein